MISKPFKLVLFMHHDPGYPGRDRLYMSGVKRALSMSNRLCVIGAHSPESLVYGPIDLMPL